MPPVFGRYLPYQHPYENALNNLKGSHVLDRALAYNIMHDHRVSEEREKEFHQFLKNPNNPSGIELKMALDDYVKGTIRTKPNPHYTQTDVNAKNLLNGTSRFRLKVKRNQKLVRVLDLNGLWKVFEWAKLKRISGDLTWGDTFYGFPANTSANNPDVMKWLDEKLEGDAHQKRTLQEVEAFIEQTLDLLGNYSKQVEPYQPVWAALWSSFVKGGINQDKPERWLQSLGVHRHNPCWVILLRYTVENAGIIARPTQLDAGAYSYHFPSPPQALLEVGGCAMDLCNNPQSNNLIPEFIHNQIEHSIGHWINADRKYGRAAPQSCSLLNQRQAHHKLLCGNYGQGVYTWMKKPH